MQHRFYNLYPHEKILTFILYQHEIRCRYGVMKFEGNHSQLASTISKDGVVLLPTSSVWSIACNPHSTRSLARLLNLKDSVSTYPITLLFDSLTMLKRYVPKIHPRIETLLLYFERPLSIVLPVKQVRVGNHIKQLSPTITVRIAQEPYCIELIQELQSPIIVSSATLTKGWYPSGFNEIESDIIRSVDYISTYRTDDSNYAPEVIIAHDEVGELTFLRS